MSKTPYKDARVTCSLWRTVRTLIGANGRPEWSYRIIHDYLEARRVK